MKTYDDVGEVGGPEEFVPLGVTVSKGLMASINRKGTELGFNRTRLIREAADILIQISKEDYGKLQRTAQRHGILVSKLVQQAVSNFVSTDVEISVKIGEPAQGTSVGKFRRRRCKPSCRLEA